MSPFDLAVPFCEVEPLSGCSFPISFRALITATDADNWTLDTIEIPTGNTNEWAEARTTGRASEQAIRALCFDYLTSDAGYAAVEAAILAELPNQIERSHWDRADDARRAA